MRWSYVGGALAAVIGLGGGLGGLHAAPKGSDSRLADAKAFVEKSPRYLHHSKLKRGMTGYGLTVLEGTQVVRFNARVVSVVSQWGPHQDVILAMMSGQRLEHTGIISGMSGSPVYFRDPADGKFKLAGAVAYGWRDSKDPLCGIQPITQMLAAGEVFRNIGKADKPVAARAGGARGWVGLPGAKGLEAYLGAVLDPAKRDFAALCLPGPRRGGGAAEPALVPLATPLMVSAMPRRALAEMTRALAPAGIVPVASGGVNAAVDEAAKAARIEPGGAIAVQVVAGDADLAAVGTVTDVVGGKVLAFGHSFFGDGDLELPLGPAYVHTVVPGLLGSFKLGAGLKITGSLRRDEETAITGVLGPRPKMIPLTVTVERKPDGRKEVFRYELCKHRMLTTNLTRFMLFNASEGWHLLPEYHTVRHQISVDFGKLGTYRASGAASNADVYGVISDTTRPIAAMMNNPFGEDVAPRRIDVRMTVEARDRSATMLKLELDGETWRPGQTVTGTLTYRPARQDRKTMPIRFDLPEDLPEGKHSLTVCDVGRHLAQQRGEAPHLYSPRTTRQLFEAIQRIASPAADQLYLRLPLPDGGGLAIDTEELPDLPPSRAAILGQAKLLDAKTFRRSLVRTVRPPYLMEGSLTASFDVARQPRETLLHE